MKRSVCGLERCQVLPVVFPPLVVAAFNGSAAGIVISGTAALAVVSALAEAEEDVLWLDSCLAWL